MITRKSTVLRSNNGVFDSTILVLLFRCQLVSNKEKIGTHSRPLLGATIAPSIVPWVLKKKISLEMVKNDICLGGTSKAPFLDNVP